MNQHVPVLLDEVLDHLVVRADGVYVDATFGRGGHSREILRRLGPEGRLLAIDRDPAAVESAKTLARTDARLTPVHGSFGDLRGILMGQAIFGSVDGIVLDLGVSSPQFDDAERGFSFMADGPLDMRMDPATQQSAAAWLNAAGEAEIAQVLSRFGEERQARRIARAICRERQHGSISRTLQLAELIERVKPRRGDARHPATKSFQAIRIYINDELEQLRRALEASLDGIAQGGRLCVVSFHSLEDRIVKRFMRDHARVAPALADLPVVPESARPRLRVIGRAIRPGADEQSANPRSRSAVLRVAERIA